MVQIQFVTVHGCKEAECPDCDVAEGVLRTVLKLAGIDLPAHEEGSQGEVHLSDGRQIEAVHLECEDLAAHGLVPEDAPWLFVDGEIVMTGILDPQALARALMGVLFPNGLADLRP